MKLDKVNRIRIFVFLIIGISLLNFTVVRTSKASDSPPVEWSKTYGGELGDQAHWVEKTLDGGYIITGYTNSFSAGSNDVWLIKTDKNGNVEWDKNFGGSASDSGYQVQQTNDGGFIVTGFTYSFGAGDADIYLIKTDENGNEEWTNTFGGSGHDVGESVQQTAYGFIIAGYTNTHTGNLYDILIIKTDSNGNKLWEKLYGGSDTDLALDIKQTKNGEFIVTGITHSFGIGHSNVLLMKIDKDGNQLFLKSFGGSDRNEGHTVQQTSDDGYIIVGATSSYGSGSYDYWLIKTDSDGNKEFDKTYGGSSYDIANSVQQTMDGGYIIAGSSSSFGASDYDGWLIKTDQNGNVEWDKTFGEENNDFLNSVQQTSDGGFVVSGTTYSFGVGVCDAWLIKLTPSFDFSIFATNSILVKQGATVNTGNIGVLDASAGPWLDSQSEVTIGINVFISDNIKIYGDTIKIKLGASVWDVYYNELTNNGTIRGTETTPLELPLDVNLAPFPTPNPGVGDIIILPSETLTLEPGSYGEILIKMNATLILTGGTYHFENFNIGLDNVNVFCQGPTNITINNRLEPGKNAFIGPAEGSGINASDICIYVNGINGSTGKLGATPKAAVIGYTNNVQANIYAPNGTVWIKEGSVFEGSLIGKDVIIGYNVQVIFNSSF